MSRIYGRVVPNLSHEKCPLRERYGFAGGFFHQSLRCLPFLRAFSFDSALRRASGVRMSRSIKWPSGSVDVVGASGFGGSLAIGSGYARSSQLPRLGAAMLKRPSRRAATMCYSAQVFAGFRKFQRQTGAKMDIKEYVRLFWRDLGKDPYPKRPKVPRAMEIDILRDGPPEAAEFIRQWDAAEVDELSQELFRQKKRVADGERKLAEKATKKAQDDVRIGTDKMARIQARIDTLKRTEPKASDSRIFPGYYVPVMVMEDGERVVKPMRYQCRPAGKPAFYDTKFPGTYNARRDSLDGFWKGVFGRQHAIMVADVFYENVEVDGQNQVLAFTPRDAEPMLIACLWSRWTDPTGTEPDLLSFAAITDEPEPEVAAAGHDRTIINIKPEHVDAWLNPNAGDLASLQAIFDDKRRPYYEHQIAA